MHDPLVVAFHIPRPWPKRVNWPHRRWYFPAAITVWHVEPKGHDSGEVCRHYVKTQQADGSWRMKMLNGWRFHVHHWKLQVHPLQQLRRALLTRCAWCGGRSTKRDAVNFSHSWNGTRSPWWRGEIGLYHCDCSAVWSAHRSCVCEDPLLDHTGYGTCARCGKGRSFGVSERGLAIHRGLQTIPAGARDRAVYERVCAQHAPPPEEAK